MGSPAGRSAVQGASEKSGALLLCGIGSTMTDQEALVYRRLARILSSGEYGLGALVLTLPADPGKGTVRIVSAVALSKPSPALAPDLVELPKRLRGLAEEIEQIVAGRAALPPQPR